MKYFKILLVIIEICTIGIFLIILGALLKSCLSFQQYLEDSITVNYKMYKTQILTILRGGK